MRRKKEEVSQGRKVEGMSGRVRQRENRTRGCATVNFQSRRENMAALIEG